MACTACSIRRLSIWLMLQFLTSRISILGGGGWVSKLTVMKDLMRFSFEQVADQDKWKMSFVMPSKYGSDLPLPEDPSVTIKEVPSKIVAVVAFSGLFSSSNYIAFLLILVWQSEVFHIRNSRIPCPVFRIRAFKSDENSLLCTCLVFSMCIFYFRGCCVKTMHQILKFVYLSCVISYNLCYLLLYLVEMLR